MGLSFNLGFGSKKPEETKKEEKTEIQNNIKKEETDQEQKDEKKESSISNFTVPKTETPSKKEEPKTMSNKVSFKPKTTISIRDNYTWQAIVLVIFGAFSFIFYFSFNYVKLYDTISSDLPTDTLVMEYESYESQINDLLHIYSPESYETLPSKGKQATNTINSIIGATDINYIHKWKLLTKVFKDLTSESISIGKKIEEIKGNITKYGFSPKEIDDILGGDDKNKISLQRSLLSLEVIKFSTAMKVFGLLHTFLEQFSHYYSIDTDLLRRRMAFYSSRTEIDIERYLQACYLNPFEDLKKCSFIGDFDNYYTFFEPQTDIKPGLFKELMNFIDQKLTETSFPSLTITFNKFDPQSKNMAFKVVVNTFQNDEIELINQGIVSPHIFVVTSVINLLKQSNFILGEKINIQDMRIDTNTVEIGGKEFVVHSSTRNFDLPIQPDVQVEIFDYTPNVSIYNNNLLKDKTKIDLNKYGTENEGTKIKKTDPKPKKEKKVKNKEKPDFYLDDDDETKEEIKEENKPEKEENKPEKEDIKNEEENNKQNENIENKEEKKIESETKKAENNLGTGNLTGNN